ncbi:MULTISPECIES: hypothetical protein [Providencia]|uniref:hypothetical protein n=1 Tax=Providencia TaxID=586 RepID=UPI00234BC1E1|nr:hypothetical protein [Providencia sp. PROV089]
MRKSALAFVVICWIFAIALAFCLPATASVSTTNHATLIAKKSIDISTVERKSLPPIVVKESQKRSCHIKKSSNYNISTNTNKHLKSESYAVNKPCKMVGFKSYGVTKK